MFFTVRHLFFLLFLVLGQNQLGFGNDDDDGGVDGDPEYKEEEYSTYQVQSFTAVSSLLFSPGSDYKVFFTVNPNPNPDPKKEPLQLKCILMAKSNKTSTIESAPISVRSGESGHISIPLPREMPRNESIWRLFAWQFTEESREDEYRNQAPHTLIYSSLGNENGLSRKKVDIQSIFIQTDKPVYKPDDLVRIRVVTMGSNDLPHLTAGVNMTITDSQGNVMKKWEQPLELPPSASVPSNVSSSGNGNGKLALFGEFQKKKNGLSSYEYQLSSEPILGTWTIQVEAGNIKEKMYFDVKKYILPKFQVKIEVPSVLYGFGEITATATIKVSYTYGKGLQGTGNVTVTSSYDGRTKTQQFVVKDGEVKVPLEFTSSSIHSTAHTITANVTEKNTGRWQIGKKTVRIFPREKYTVQWINKPALYNPGLPITVQLKITGQDGFPVKVVRHNSLRIIFSSSLNLLTKYISIPLSGIATFTFPTPRQPITVYSTFQVLYKHATYYFTLPTAERATSSGILIEIVSPPDTANFIPGNSYNFTIRSNKPIKPKVIHCLLWDDAAMEVNGAQTILNNNPREHNTEFPFSLQIPKGPFEELKIYVYFETADNRGDSHLISTSKSIKIINNYLKIRVSRPIPKRAPAPDAPLKTTTKTSVPFTTTADEDCIYCDYPYDDPEVAEQEESEISSKLEVEPGAAVEIHFETYPGSTIAVRGIDQSLLLLTEQDNDLNQEAVHSKRASSQPRRSHLDDIPEDTHRGCFRENLSFLKTFRRLGIVVLISNSDDSFWGLCATSSGNSLKEAEMAPSPNLVPDESTAPQVDSRLRTKFPETWLWEEFESSSNSSTTTLNKILPDTFTSWIISGFSLNPQTGLGVASPATITGFMPFFVTLNLPYSVVKYESFDLQVIVHNYLDRDVTLFNRHNDFDFDFDGRQNNQTGNKTRSIKVQRNHAALAHFVITPMVIGDIPIEVKVVTEDGSAGDAMFRHLKVKPDGVRETRSQTVTFDAKPGAKNLSREAGFDVEFPENVVKGASSLRMTVVGDPMATIVSQLATPRRSRSSSSGSNLGRLLRIPSGCGEQNMIGLVPNILVLHYLTATNSDAKDVMQKAKQNLETGYGNQLQYQKREGSFAVWEHQPGTTWLTSYVLRWFVEAQKYVTIDNNVIKRATEFLLSRQLPDGSFLSLVAGPTYHPELCLYGCNSVALTAYITLALIKVNQTSRSNTDLNLRVAIEKGMNFISRQSVYDVDDNYITNLVAATLMAGNHREKPRFFEKMEKGAKATTEFKYWDMKNKTERANGPLAIEMTSYALLAHLWKKREIDSSAPDIHRWLLSQRTPNGGFISTQDTAMGLSALTEFALAELALKTKIVDNSTSKIVDEDKIELSIRASGSSLSSSSLINANSDFNFSDNANDKEIQVSVLRWNRMVLQEFELPVSANKVNLLARGSGRAVVQMTQTWYVPTQNKLTTNSSDHFNINAKMRIPDPEEPSETELALCVNSNHASGSKDSIASVQLPSGYIFSPEDYGDNNEFMKNRPGNVQRFELTEGNGKMDVYYTEIKGHPPTCFSLAATQQFEVANAKSPVIEVYEYLDPETKGRIVYEPAHKITQCQLCRHTDTCSANNCD